MKNLSAINKNRLTLLFITWPTKIDQKDFMYHSDAHNFIILSLSTLTYRIHLSPESVLQPLFCLA